MNENATHPIRSDDEPEPELSVADYEACFNDMTELVARVRHEINNPLTGILGQAQLLLREELTEKTRKRVETIESLAVRLKDIAAQLREVQRPSKTTDSDKT